MNAEEFAQVKAIVRECYEAMLDGTHEVTDEVDSMSAADIMRDYKQFKQDARFMFPEFKAVFRKYGVYV